MTAIINTFSEQINLPEKKQQSEVALLLKFFSVL